MKITFVCPPLSLSGGIRVVALHAAWLQAAGHEVTVVAPPHPAPGRWSRGLARLGLPRPPAATQEADHVSRSGVPLRRLGWYRPVREADVPDADVIIATWWETAEWVARMGPRKGRKLYFVQGHEVFDFLPRDRVEATYRAPFQKIVVARWLADLMATRYGDAGAIVVPNAIDRAQFQAPPRGRQSRPTVGTLFHETGLKGFDTALAVLHGVRAVHPDLRVIAFGAAPPALYREQMAGIELVVAPPQEEIARLYAACDLWLSCSRTEGFNLTAMEAMACRTPLVSTRTGWPEEAVQAGVNGALAEVDDVPALTAAALGILALPDAAWRRLSEGALQTVAQASWEASSQAFERALRQAIEA